MLTFSLFARLEAKPGKENEVAAFLMHGLQLANKEATTPLWFALRLGPSTFTIAPTEHEHSLRFSHSASRRPPSAKRSSTTGICAR